MSEKIIIIQPDAIQSRRLHHILFDLGHASLSVRSAEEALRLIESDGVPLMIVLELSLPGVDGFEFLRQLREKADAERCPAIAVTAFPSLLSAALKERDTLGIHAAVSVRTRAVSLSTLIESALGNHVARREHMLKEAFQPPLALLQKNKAREGKRLAKIAGLHLDKELAEDLALTKLVKDAARAFDFPVALVSIVLEDRQWFKAHTGLTGKLLEDKGSPRDWAFCAHVVEADEPVPLVVPDAKTHPVFKDNPLVTEGQIGSYAGAPIVTADGEVLGSFCIADRKPRALNPEDVDLLTALARRVAGELEVSRQLNALKGDLNRQWDHAMDREGELGMARAVLAWLDIGVMLHDSAGKMLFINKKLCELTGLEEAQLEEVDLAGFKLAIAPLFDEPALVMAKMAAAPDGGPYTASEVFETQRPRRQVLRWSARPVPIEDGWCQLSTWEDITAEHDLAEQRERLSTMDPLTGLLNRRGAEEEAARESERARRKNRLFSVLLCEIDDFKALNDAQGFEKGDQALVATAEALKKSLRQMDRPSRWSGRHFMVLLPETGEEDARLVAERVRKNVDKIKLDFKFSVSLGVACCGDKPDFEACLGMATLRLEMATSMGKNQVL